MSAELGLAEVTIKQHLHSIFRKMGARSRSDAAVIATKADAGGCSSYSV
jgi:DNA-binding NarL/FixJ family response regulator